MRSALIATMLVVTAAPAAPPSRTDYSTDRVLTLREQNAMVCGWKEKRFDRLLPGLMRREGVGMWIVVSREQGVPARGDYIFRPNTWHAIELNATRGVPEWDGQPVRFMLEEDAGLFDQGWSWIDGRRDTYYLIK